MSEFDIDFADFGAATVADAAARFQDRCDVVTRYNAARDQGELFDNELDFCTVSVGKLEFALRKLDPNQSDRLVNEVNDALMRARVQSHIGTTSGIPGCMRTGEYDVALRGMIAIVYRYHRNLPTGRQLVRQEVRDHVVHDLLTICGPHDPSVESWTCTDLPLSFPETENHLLMIESSRYLTNQLLLEEARSAGRDAPEFDNARNRDGDGKTMDKCILEKLQGFLRNDFSEYNSRSYQVYSTLAIQNLFDFAQNPVVTLAARMVLDYIAAKFAVSSNFLRRAVPFRRLRAQKDLTALFDHEADPQTLRFILLSGQMDRLADVNPPNVKAAYGARDLMQFAAVSNYRIPRMVMNLAMNKADNPYYQRIRHSGVELFSSRPEFLITGGGIWMESTHGHDEFTVPPYNDAGWALPTTLMPTKSGFDRKDFIRIEGNREDHQRMNTGVGPSFACGMNPFVPDHYRKVQDGPWTFVDASADGFYAAVFSSGCSDRDCSLGADANTSSVVLAEAALGLRSFPGTFGFFEATPITMSFDDFRAGVKQRNGRTAFTAERERLCHDGRPQNPVRHQSRATKVQLGDYCGGRISVRQGYHALAAGHRGHHEQ